MSRITEDEIMLTNHYKVINDITDKELIEWSQIFDAYIAFTKMYRYLIIETIDGTIKHLIDASTENKDSKKINSQLNRYRQAYIRKHGEIKFPEEFDENVY